MAGSEDQTQQIVTDIIVDGSLELGDIVISADQARAAYQAEKQLGELGDKVEGADKEQIEAAITELRAKLHALSPRVEPGEPGTGARRSAGLSPTSPGG